MEKKPYMMSASNKQNALIAERVVEFLRKRIQIYQSLIPKYIKDEEAYGKVESIISLDDFLSKHHQIELQSNSKENEFEKLIINQKLEIFERAFSKYIVLQESEIEELLSLVKESVTNYGLGKTTFELNEADFIKRVLEQLYAAYLLTSKKKPNTKYLRYANIISKTKAGFCNKISPLISWNLYYTFKIVTTGNEEDEEICHIDESGTEVEDNKIADEIILLAENLQVAKFKTRNGKKDCLVFFLVETKDGKSKQKRILNSGYFDLNNPLERERVLNSNETELYDINEFLRLYGLSEFIDHIYNYNELFNIICEFDKLQDFSEEQKNGVRDVVSSAADFWVNAFVNNGQIKNINVPILKKFAHLLSKEIRLGLTKTPYYYLEAEYNKNNPLYKIAEEAQIDLYFADNEMAMWINHSEVSIGSKITKEKQSLYKVGDKPNQGQGNSTCPKLEP